MERTGNVEEAISRHYRIYGNLKEQPETWDSMIAAMNGRNPWEPAYFSSFYDDEIPKDRKRYLSEDGATTSVFGAHGVTLGTLRIVEVEVYGPWAQGERPRFEYLVSTKL
jgi:hypothetical protein